MWGYCIFLPCFLWCTNSFHLQIVYGCFCPRRSRTLELQCIFFFWGDFYDVYRDWDQTASLLGPDLSKKHRCKEQFFFFRSSVVFICTRGSVCESFSLLFLLLKHVQYKLWFFVVVVVFLVEITVWQVNIVLWFLRCWMFWGFCFVVWMWEAKLPLTSLFSTTFPAASSFWRHSRCEAVLAK